MPLTTTASARQLSDGNSQGQKLGQSAADLVGFYGVTPVAQPAQPATHIVSTTAAGTTGAVFANTTFPGAAGLSNYTIGDIVTALKAIGVLAL
jgi:hypothetical protein